MDWHIALGVVSGLLSIYACVPYIQDILRKTTKPHTFTWFGWLFLLLIAFFAQLSSGASWSILLLAGDILGTGIIAFLSLTRGLKKYSNVDFVCFATGIIAVVLWQLTKEPVLAIVLSVMADALITLPTLLKAIKDPHSETPSTYFIITVAAILGIISTTRLDLANLIFPIYIATINLLIGSASYYGRRNRKV